MDVFADAVSALDRAWQPQAAAAASGVTLTLDGRPVAVAADGAFRLPLGARGTLQAFDGAGGRTSVVLGSAPASGRAARGVRRIASLRRLRGRRLRVAVTCPETCAGLARVRSGHRLLARRGLRLHAHARGVVVLRLPPHLPARGRVSFPHARSRSVRLR